MAMTAPGMRPASMSAFSVAPIRASRSGERPTSSGLARGRGSSANAAVDASRQSAVARIRMAAMDVSRSGSSALHYGSTLGQGGPTGQRRCYSFGWALPAFMQGWRRVAVGGEFAVLDAVLLVRATVVGRLHGSVGLLHKSIFTCLFELREENAQIQSAIAGNLGADDRVFILGVAEIAPVHDLVACGDLVGQHRTFVPAGGTSTVHRPSADQSPFARGCGDGFRGGLQRQRKRKNDRQYRPAEM